MLACGFIENVSPIRQGGVSGAFVTLFTLPTQDLVAHANVHRHDKCLMRNNFGLQSERFSVYELTLTIDYCVQIGTNNIYDSISWH